MLQPNQIKWCRAQVRDARGVAEPGSSWRQQHTRQPCGRQSLLCCNRASTQCCRKAPTRKAAIVLHCPNAHACTLGSKFCIPSRNSFACCLIYSLEHLDWHASNCCGNLGVLRFEESGRQSSFLGRNIDGAPVRHTGLSFYTHISCLDSCMPTHFLP